MASSSVFCVSLRLRLRLHTIWSSPVVRLDWEILRKASELRDLEKPSSSKHSLHGWGEALFDGSHTDQIRNGQRKWVNCVKTY